MGLIGIGYSSVYLQSVFALLLKYSSAVGEKELADFDALSTDLKQLTPFLEPNDQAMIVGALNVLQQMIIGKFYASAQAYFRYLSLDIHNQQHVSLSSCFLHCLLTASLRIV